MYDERSAFFGDLFSVLAVVWPGRKWKWGWWREWQRWWTSLMSMSECLSVVTLFFETLLSPNRKSIFSQIYFHLIICFIFILKAQGSRLKSSASSLRDLNSWITSLNYSSVLNSQDPRRKTEDSESWSKVFPSCSQSLNNVLKMSNTTLQVISVLARTAL